MHINKKYYLFIAPFVVLLIVLLMFMAIKRPSPDNLTNVAVPANEISQQQIVNHNIVTDCWVAIGGSVYRLDNYFAKHPDTTLASQLCGKIEPEIKLPDNLRKGALTGYRIGLLTP